ncbi:MAG TPA: hypothetical protein VIG48_00770 [Jatrophihabitans sp.]|jgi:hypothetical protein
MTIGDRWGVTEEETARRYPCDDEVSAPELQLWRGVTVHAAPGELWPWVAQVRLAPYSYDWIDNLGRRSPRDLRGLPDPVAGEPFTRALGRPQGLILSVAVGEQLTGRLLGVVMSYVLVAQPNATRLLLKLVSDRFRRAAPLLSLGDLVMARQQLLNFKHLAESGRAPCRHRARSTGSVLLDG